jgi:hypothetical protein
LADGGVRIDPLSRPPLTYTWYSFTVPKINTQIALLSY